MKKKVRALLLVVFLISTGLLVKQLSDNAGGSESYAAARSIATSGGSKTAAPRETEAAETEKNEPEWVPETVTGDEQLDALAQLDLDALREVNPDVMGWIRIPDSKIDYPIVQGTDNDYYLKHTWEGKENSVGSIFLEHQSSAALTDFNTIVYGHNMKDGSMFAGIRRYETEWYWERHPYVYIATDAGVWRYEVFASYEAPVKSITYALGFPQEKTKVDFLTNALERSVVDTMIQPELTDRILTLSTCSGMGSTSRWVLHARLKMVPAE